MKIKWNLWRGFFCLADDLPQEIIDICNQIIDENERNPAKYKLTGEHYFISRVSEEKLTIGFAPRRMMQGAGYWTPSFCRLLFAMIFSCLSCYLFLDECRMWLTYLFPSIMVSSVAPEAIVCGWIAAGTFLIFFLSGAPRMIPLLYIISWIPVGMVGLLGAMKKNFAVALLVPIAIAAVYALIHRFSSPTDSKKRWAALRNSVCFVAVIVSFVSSVSHLMPYDAGKDHAITAKVPPELTERYERACAELPLFHEKSSEEKLDILQAICDYECIVGFGCTSPQVREGSISALNAIGAYLDSTKTITIRPDHLKSSDTKAILNTLLHEVRHHMQFRLVDLYRSLEPYIPKEYKSMSPFKEAVLFGDNFNNYQLAENDYELYYGQAVEEDSRRWAEDRIEHYLPFLDVEEKAQ